MAMVWKTEEHRKVGNSIAMEKRAGRHEEGGSGDYISKISTSDAGPTKGNLIDFGRQKTSLVM